MQYSDKLKVKPEEREPEVCRICGQELVKGDYVGLAHFSVLASFKRFFGDLLLMVNLSGLRFLRLSGLGIFVGVSSVRRHDIFGD